MTRAGAHASAIGAWILLTWPSFVLVERGARLEPFMNFQMDLALEQVCGGTALLVLWSEAVAALTLAAALGRVSRILAAILAVTALIVCFYLGNNTYGYLWDMQHHACPGAWGCGEFAPDK